ncbi:PEGA domain-containing protein [Calditrichota bacterium]
MWFSQWFRRPLKFILTAQLSCTESPIYNPGTYSRFIVLLLFCFAGNVFPSEKTNIAVLDLIISESIPESYRSTLSDRLRLELHETASFNVIERNAMEDILKEQGFQLTDCSSDECAVEAGRLLGVERMVAGSIGRVGNTHTVILRVINVESGVIEDTKKRDCVCEIDDVMTVSLKVVARQLAGLEVDESLLEALKGPVGKGNLFLKSEPPGADIYIDNAKYDGITPLVIEDINAGQHILKLEKDNLFATAPVFITANQIKQMNLSLEQLCELEIIAEVAKGTVTINGKPEERSFPAKIPKLVAGKYDIVVEAKGYESFSQSVSLKAGEKAIIKAEMQRHLGKLSFAKVPNGTEIYLNGKKLGKAPQEDKNLETGWHTVKLLRKGYLEGADQDIEIKHNEVSTVVYDLKLIPDEPGFINPALMRSLMWPGLGQIKTGRKIYGWGYASGEVAALGFLGFSILGYNSKVQEYNDAVETFNEAKSVYDNAGEGADFITLYNTKVSTYQNATDADNEMESAKIPVYIAAGLAGGLYLWNIADTFLFTGIKDSKDSEEKSQAIKTQTDISIIGYMRGKPVARISLNIRFDISRMGI